MAGAVPFTQKLWVRLAVAFLLVAGTGVLVVSLLANRATTAGFNRFLDAEAEAEWTDLQAELAGYYRRTGSWTGVDGLLTAVQPGRGQGGLALVLLDENDQVVAAAGGQRNRPAGADDADLALPVEVNGREVGQLLIRAPGGAGASRAGEQFLAEVNRAILWGGLTAALLALGLGLLLARRLTQPLHRLTAATRRLAAGDLTHQVPVASRDELGELATGFNQMSTALADAENQRRQLLADVAHELRTPLSVMRSHIEAMLDGVFELTPENLAIAHEETILLGRLVEDLRTLSLAEAGQLPLQQTPLDMTTLVTQIAAAFAPLAEAKGGQLTTEIDPDLPPVPADENRIKQVLGNLLANALRHARPDGPQVTVSARRQTAAVQIRVADNGSGLSAEAQAHIFDRFWRADNARSRDQGGSGLGLAICQAIVQAHNGRIWVESRPGEGSVFVVELVL